MKKKKKKKKKKKNEKRKREEKKKIELHHSQGCLTETKSCGESSRDVIRPLKKKTKINQNEIEGKLKLSTN